MRASLSYNQLEPTKALHNCRIPDSETEKCFDDLTRIAAQICRTPMALICLVDEDEQWIKSRYGLDADETSPDLTFWAYSILEDDVFVVPDALADERFAGNNLIISEPYIRFYAGAPLMTDEGYCIGTICVLDRTPRELSETEKRSLRALAKQVVLMLEMKRSSTHLAAVNEELTAELNERRQHVRELMECENRYRLVFEHADDLIYTADSGGNFVYFNSCASKLTGYDESELINFHYLDLVRPDYRKQAEEFYRAQFLEKTPNTYFEFPVRTKSGTTVWFGQNVQMFFEAEKFNGFQAVARDITKSKQSEILLRESEVRFRSAFEYAPIGMAMIGLNGEWLNVNRSLCEMLGYSENELLGKFFQDITHPEDLELDLEFVRKMIDGELNTYQMEKRYFHKLGKMVWVLLSVSLVRDSSGAPLYFISQIQNITEGK